MRRAASSPRANFKVWRLFTTRWADNDSYGHVNNTVFYQWFDSAVNAWLVEQQMLDILVGGTIGLVVETRCSFFAPLAFPQNVEVGLTVAELGHSSVRYRLGVFGEGEEQASAEGEFVHVLVDRERRTPTAIPADWRSKLEAIS